MVSPRQNDRLEQLINGEKLGHGFRKFPYNGSAIKRQADGSPGFSTTRGKTPA